MNQEELTDKEELDLLLDAKKNLAWLEEHFGEVLRAHNNEYVAIKGGELIGSSKTLDSLLDELKKSGADLRKTVVEYITEIRIL